MTDRQALILSAIVELYAQTAEPVGSLALADAFDVSPATIRAEMAALERLGLIAQPHTSAGRVPTDQGYRAYVNGLSSTPDDGRVSRAIMKRVSSAGEVDAMIKQAAVSLSEVTSNAGIGTLSSSLFITGLAQLFGQPEFRDGLASFEVARLLDNLEEWTNEVTTQGRNRVSVLEDRTNVWIGHENPIGKTSGCSLIIGRFSSPFSDSSYIGVLGPTRQNYNQVIGLVGYVSQQLEEVLV